MRQPTILDHHGNPIRRKVLAEEIAAPSVTGIRSIWSPAVATGLTPQGLADILRRAAEGDAHDYLALAEEMEERDPHYASVLGVRKRAVSGVTPTVKAASEDSRDEEIAQAVRETIAGHDGLPDLIEDLMDALGKGFSVIEHVWKTGPKRWEPGEFIFREQRFFKFDRETGSKIMLIDEADVANGIPLEPGKFITHMPKLKSGIALRGGLARLVAFGWMCKAYTMKDWIAFIETYGLPMRLGRYGREATPDDVNILARAVANIGTDAAAVLPDHMRIDFEATADGTGSAIFEKLARWVDEQTSKAVLGQTMTSDNGSSNAQAQVHDEVRHDILRSDARKIAQPLNRDLVKPFVDLNFGPQENYPQLVFPVDEPEDIDLLVKSVERLSNVGVTFKQTELRAKLKLSDPDDDDAVTSPGIAALPAPTSPALNRREETGRLDPMDDWALQLGPVVDPVRTAIAESGSYEEALERLRTLAPEMELSALIQSLVTAAVASRAAGDQE